MHIVKRCASDEILSAFRVPLSVLAVFILTIVVD